MTRKIIGIIIYFSAVITQAAAQRLSIELDGGLQGIQYPLRDGRTSLLPGGSLGLLYTFPVKGGWDLLAGITGSIYHTRATIPDGAVFTNYQVDDAGSAFEYSVKTAGYQETQQFFAAGIPVLLQYHTGGRGMQWYVNGGGKFLFPSGVTTRIAARQLNLAGYYPDYNIEVSNLPQHGFGTISNWTARTSTPLKPAVALTAATGMSFPISHYLRLYTGLFVEYGVTDLRSRSDSMPLVTYNPGGVSGVKGNGVQNMQNAGRPIPLSFGLQVRIAFAARKTEPAARPKPKKLPQQPVDSALTGEEADFIQQPVIFGVIQEIAIPEVVQPHLDDVAAIMLQHPTIRISIVGHICNSGTETEDPKVGLARAEAIAKYLKEKGVPLNRMNIGVVNVSEPVLPNNPAANFQKRRVVIKME